MPSLFEIAQSRRGIPSQALEPSIGIEDPGDIERRAARDYFASGVGGQRGGVPGAATAAEIDREGAAPQSPQEMPEKQSPAAVAQVAAAQEAETPVKQPSTDAGFYSNTPEHFAEADRQQRQLHGIANIVRAVRNVAMAAAGGGAGAAAGGAAAGGAAGGGAAGGAVGGAAAGGAAGGLGAAGAGGAGAAGGASGAASLGAGGATGAVPGTAASSLGSTGPSAAGVTPAGGAGTTGGGMFSNFGSNLKQGFMNKQGEGLGGVVGRVGRLAVDNQTGGGGGGGQEENPEIASDLADQAAANDPSLQGGGPGGGVMKGIGSIFDQERRAKLRGLLGEGLSQRFNSRIPFFTGGGGGA